MPQHLDYGVSQIRGSRDYQQDSYCVRQWRADAATPGVLLAVLCDGMAGHGYGELASQLASRQFVAAVQAAPAEVALALALEHANQAISDERLVRQVTQGMGTTLLAVRVVGTALTWISVGDTALWLFRQGHLTRLNADHSMKPVLQKMVEMGELTADDAAHDSKRHMLRSALNGQPPKLIDQSATPLLLQPGDYLLLASDGLEPLPMDALLDQLGAAGDAACQPLAERLISALDALQHPQQDNATLIVIRITDDTQ